MINSPLDTRTFRAAALFILFAPFSLSLATAQGPSSGDDASAYIRVFKDSKGRQIALQTAIATFKAPKTGHKVALIAAVHIGTESYYTTLNKIFQNYDYVLYEMVTDGDVKGAKLKTEAKEIPTDSDLGDVELDEQTKEPKRGLGASLVSGMQTTLADFLGLSLQMRGVDYTRSNMLHADLSWEGLQELMQRRNESWLGLLLKLYQSALKAELSSGGSSNAAASSMFVGLFHPSFEKRLLFRRRAFTAGIMGSPDMAATLVGDCALIGGRNDRALAVLSEEIKKAKTPKSFAIFYGAGHMGDFERKLIANFSLDKKNVSWLDAWPLR